MQAFLTYKATKKPMVRAYYLWDTTQTTNNRSAECAVRAVVLVNPDLTVDSNGNLVAK